MQTKKAHTQSSPALVSKVIYLCWPPPSRDRRVSPSHSSRCTSSSSTSPHSLLPTAQQEAPNALSLSLSAVQDRPSPQLVRSERWGAHLTSSAGIQKLPRRHRLEEDQAPQSCGCTFSLSRSAMASFPSACGTPLPIGHSRSCVLATKHRALYPACKLHVFAKDAGWKGGNYHMRD